LRYFTRVQRLLLLSILVSAFAQSQGAVTSITYVGSAPPQVSNYEAWANDSELKSLRKLLEDNKWVTSILQRSDVAEYLDFYQEWAADDALVVSNKPRSRFVVGESAIYRLDFPDLDKEASLPCVERVEPGDLIFILRKKIEGMQAWASLAESDDRRWIWDRNSLCKQKIEVSVVSKKDFMSQFKAKLNLRILRFIDLYNREDFSFKNDLLRRLQTTLFNLPFVFEDKTAEYIENPALRDRPAERVAFPGVPGKYGNDIRYLELGSEKNGGFIPREDSHRFN
jgi:hypothetical protein